ncbi:Arachidonate 12-lipoxygenase, 12S-type [Myotis davidii]|uniref:Arachidonate 12-lipoxygenase, 12S-type n=1 Tax=Myotis davidii TaxID=225400 RepID=L5LTC8_MYODS|nr:Arachidonate 12-lipoxygenase, 12S-type [Myotis davidii]
MPGQYHSGISGQREGPLRERRRGESSVYGQGSDDAQSSIIKKKKQHSGPHPALQVYRVLSPQVEEFEQDVPQDLGPLQLVKLRKHHSLVDDAWFCDRITVQGPGALEEAAFPCYRWVQGQGVLTLPEGTGEGPPQGSGCGAQGVVEVIQPPSASCPTPPLFLPSDPPLAWLLAKTWVRSSDFLVHETQYHLLNIHMLGEVIAVATMRCLPGLHPVFKVPLGHHQEEYFSDPEPKAVLRQFQADLDNLEKEIVARNEQLDLPYEHLKPSLIENSITI